MAITFPSSPSTGQVFTVGNRSWTWDGSSWKGAPSTTGDATTLDSIDSLQFLRSDADDTITGQIVFPSTNANKPVFPQGLLARADLTDTSGFHDIWGISERYYPSNSTAADAWGIRWSGTPNEIQFIGSGTEKFKVDLDTGAATATSFIGDGSNLTGLPAGYTDANVITHLNTKSLYFNGGNIGISDSAPFSKLQVGGNTFSGANGMNSDSRVGISNHGSLTGLMLASTYNDSTYPEYGLVFVQGPSTSSYNVWSISPEGPAVGDSLHFIYASNTTNIHTTTPNVTFDGNGRVGIGEKVPLGKLHVKDGDAGSITANGAHDTVIIEGSGNTGINIFSPNTSYQYLAFGDTEGSNSGYVRYQHSTNQMVLRAGAKDIVFINDDYVTIDGTAAWNAGDGMLNIGGAGDGRLQVRHIWGKSSSSSGTDDLWLQYSNAGQHVQVGASGGGNNLYVSGNIYANGYFAGNRVLTQADEGSGNGLDADTLDGVQGTGYLSNGLVANKAQILMINRVNSTSTGISWYDEVYNSWVMYMAAAGQTSVGPRGNLTAPTGSIVTSWAQRSHIENAGGYGWTFESQSNGSTSPIVRFEISSSDGSAYSQGNITAAGNITANSDISLKDNIEVIPGALGKVLQIRGVTYNRNDIEDNPRQTGVIAQEVEKVLPEVISEDANGIKSVAYGNMIGLLIEAIKEQQARIDALEERLNADNT